MTTGPVTNRPLSGDPVPAGPSPTGAGAIGAMAVEAVAVTTPAADTAATRRGVGVDAWWALRTAALPWSVARVVVLGALVVAHELVARGHPSAAVAAHVHDGLLGWDSGWYEAIARHGYGGAGHDALRFFPLVPLLVRGLSSVPGVGVGAALLVVSNVSALVGVTLLVLLARRETGDEALARRAAWLVCLAGPAFTAVMGYAESTLLAFAVGAMLALRARAWWWAALLGALAALTRPPGVFLALAGLVEVARRTAPGRGFPRLVPRAAAVSGPVVGFGAYLCYVWGRYGDPLAPLRVQEQRTLRGGQADPLRTLAHDAWLLVHRQHLGEAMHLPWALLALALLVVCLRRWPLGYGLFAAGVLAAALSAANLDGFERYALSAFPLVLAGAGITAGPRVERTVLVLAVTSLALYSFLAFTGLYVP